MHDIKCLFVYVSSFVQVHVFLVGLLLACIFILVSIVLLLCIHCIALHGEQIDRIHRDRVNEVNDNVKSGFSPSFQSCTAQPAYHTYFISTVSIDTPYDCMIALRYVRTVLYIYTRTRLPGLVSKAPKPRPTSHPTLQRPSKYRPNRSRSLRKSNERDMTRKVGTHVCSSGELCVLLLWSTSPVCIHVHVHDVYKTRATSNACAQAFSWVWAVLVVFRIIDIEVDVCVFGFGFGFVLVFVRDCVCVCVSLSVSASVLVSV